MGEDVLCLFGFTEQEAISFENQEVILFSSSMPTSSIKQVYYDGKQCDLTLFLEFCKQFVFLSFGYKIHPRVQEENVQPWIAKCQEIEWFTRLYASSYQDFGVKVFQNLFASKDRFCDRDSFVKMENILQGMPAFICGAGPSLEAGMELLQKNPDKGVIFAGGAALGRLTKQGFPVHIGAGLDPNPCYDQVIMHSQFDIPFFYQSRFSSEILNTLQGPLFQVPASPGYTLQHWIEETKPFDTGWTVSTFCVALALYFGCNPIILVGVDLSIPYQEGQKEEGEKILYEDATHRKLWTQKDWVLSARWLEHIAQSYPAISFYNSSSCGLMIKGFNPLALKEYLPTLSDYDCRAFSQLIASLWKPSFSLKKFEELEESLDRSEGYIAQALNLLEHYYPEDPSDKGLFVLNLLDLQQEPFYQFILEPLWEIWRFPIERKVHSLDAKLLNQFLFLKRVCYEYKMLSSARGKINNTGSGAGNFH